MDTGTIWTLLLMAALLALSAGFSATEAAYSGLSRAELKTMEEGGNRRAGLALRLADRQEQILGLNDALEAVVGELLDGLRSLVKVE